MPTSRSKERLKLDTPALYRILVKGHLDECWVGAIGSMCIKESAHGDQVRVTSLEGRVRDQAELRGVLEIIHDLHLPLLSVELVSIG
jgi:hypothetical protein